MKETVDIAIVLVCTLAIICAIHALVSVLACIDGGQARAASRGAQRCEVVGRERGCVRTTAWYDAWRETCSCAQSDGERISFELRWSDR